MKDIRDHSLLAHNTFGIDARCRRYLEYASVEGRTVKQTNTLILRRGTYPAAKAQLLDDLDSAADTVYKGKVILKRP